MDVKTSKEKESGPEIKRKESSKVYFFILAIVALLLTNVYFYVKYKSSGEKLYTFALQKEKLQIEIDRIEAELDNIQNSRGSDFVVSDDIKEREQKVRSTIVELRGDLERGDLSEAQLVTLEKEVVSLKDNVSTLKVRIEDLKLQNEILQKQNQELNNSINAQVDKVEALEKSNQDLHAKVGVASSIKVSNIVINGIEVKRKGNKEIETKAKRVDELQIQFSLADNPLAKVGNKDVFVRVVDPQGNLIADSEHVFHVNNDVLQYTFKEKINFTNNGEQYEFLWSNDKQGFKKGAYTVLIYADNAIMGRSSIVLK